ncbi:MULTISPECIES: response regulator transcription factor [unclassified Pseudoalteromonas]|uniref:response regulator transcription factor n=1 Tax=unclassified Pseudoalteromonas TaxID=194690 RepID=UPI000CF5DCB9|nr:MULTISPECIES: response regulator transcription factor [unclassified Pseudoalteromonas]
MSEQQKSILYVEDDLKLAELISTFLISHGFSVTHISSPHIAAFEMVKRRYDLVLLDIGLPESDGFKVFEELQRQYSVPVIFLTARQSHVDHIHALELGAEDYLTKPISPSILLARINHCLRRNELKYCAKNAAQSQTLTIGNLVINRYQRQASLNGDRLELTTGEFDLLEKLAFNVGQVVSREHLFEAAIGRQYDGQNRTIDGRVSRLRKKLGDADEHPSRIITVWGKGYILSPDAWK